MTSALSSVDSSPVKLHREMELLLSCLKLYFDTATSDAAILLLDKAIDWEVLIQTAIDLGVMPLLYQSLRVIETHHIPRSAMMQLQNYYRMNGLHNISQTKELLKILNHLESTGILAIAFKGAVLATSAYGNVALRQFNDLDILVHRQQIWQAKTVLTAYGYRSNVSESNEKAMFCLSLQIPLIQYDAESILLNQHFEDSALHSNQARSLDLHWGISPRRRWKEQSLLWENLQTLCLMGQPVQVFSPETMLVVQCLNLAKEPNNQSLKQICDVAQIIRSTPNLNWETALRYSAALHTQKLFLIGLAVVHRTLNLPLPLLIVERFDQSQNEYSSRKHIQPSSLLDKLWLEYSYQLNTLDHWWDALFVISQYVRLLILKMLLSLNEHDREFVPLPAQLTFLYYLLRPIRLLMTYTSIGKQLTMQK